MNSYEIIDHWTKGIPYELAFWNNVFRWKHTFDGMMGWSHYGSLIELEGFDVHSFLLPTESPKVLDVGCGMSYATGNLIEKHGQHQQIDIHFVDPLATEFNKILKRYKRQLPKIEFGMVEHLSAFFPHRDADLVIIQNALDHSAFPVKGIYEALHTLKPGGILYLNHHPNEAETEHYKGFHQYNIVQEGASLVIWNKHERWDINRLLEGFAETSVCTQTNQHVVAIIRKTGEIPQHLTDNDGDKRLLAAMYIEASLWQQSFWSTLQFQSKYWLFNIIQFFAQALPWNLKMKAKKLIQQA